MWYDMTWYNMILIGGWVVTLFFCMWLLRNYKVLKVDTWHAGAVQYKDDAYVFLYWVFSTYQFISFWYNMSFLMYAFMLQGNQWRRDALASHCTLQWEWDSWRWEAHSAAHCCCQVITEWPVTLLVSMCFLLGNLGSIFQAVELYSTELHISSTAVDRYMFIVRQSSDKG